MHEADLDLETDGVPADDEATTRYAIRAADPRRGRGTARPVVAATASVTGAHLEIFEAPRYFERLVVGRDPDEVIDIVARICGICPVAYQMSAVHAFEDLVRGDRIDPAVPDAAPALLLRRVDREPRAPRLPAPRTRLPRLPERGRDGGRSPVRRGARPRGSRSSATASSASSAGGRSTRSASGSAVSPAPRGARSSRRCAPTSRWPSRMPSRRCAGRDPRHAGRRPRTSTRRPPPSHRVPDERRPHHVERRHRRRARRMDRCLRRAAGAVVDALQARARDGVPYLLGPTARVTLAGEQLSPHRTRGARRHRPRRRAAHQRLSQHRGPLGRAGPCRGRGAGPHRSLCAAGRAARGVGVASGRGRPGPPRRRADSSSTATRSTRAAWCATAQIVPPTSQNQAAIEHDLATFAPSVLDLPHAEATRRLEQLIRSYDPCISCATHFLDLRVDRS